MKKRLLLTGVAMVFVVVSLSGCAGSGVPADYEQVKSTLTAVQADLTAAKADLTAAKGELEATKDTVAGLAPQVADLSAISAYNIWYDQYYEVYNYFFEDVASFNEKLGALISATGDSASKAAWDAYLAADKALNDVVAELPQDYNTWTEEQTNRWSQASTARYNAFGEVGAALYNATNYSASQVRILELEAQVAELSAISAYGIWYDQYYAAGTEEQYYVFADVATFNWKLGTLAYATNNATVIAYWDYYLEADSALNELLAELPEDYETWTEEQTNQWSEASTARYNALGEVGTTLYNAIAGY